MTEQKLIESCEPDTGGYITSDGYSPTLEMAKDSMTFDRGSGINENGEFYQWTENLEDINNDGNPVLVKRTVIPPTKAGQIETTFAEYTDKHGIPRIDTYGGSHCFIGDGEDYHWKGFGGRHSLLRLAEKTQPRQIGIGKKWKRKQRKLR